jgi:hypothetical protein
MRKAAAMVWLAAGLVGAAAADEQRGVIPIPVRPRVATEAPPAPFRPVDLGVVEDALRAFFADWNTPETLRYLGEDFQDRSQVIDALRQVPRDAILRLLAVDSATVIDQRTDSWPASDGAVLVTSTIAAVVRSQVEFNDPFAGFVRREGVNEYVFELSEVVEAGAQGGVTEVGEE